MSILDVVELAEWRRKNMFCLYCEHYNGLDEPCHKDKDIHNIREVVNCEYYKYNGSLEE